MKDRSGRPGGVVRNSGDLPWSGPGDGRGGFLLLHAASYAAIVLLAATRGEVLGLAAALVASALCLGRYAAMALYAGRIARGSWGLALNLWIVLFGLLALLLYLAGRKGVILWPAIVALSGPALFFASALGKALAWLFGRRFPRRGGGPA